MQKILSQALCSRFCLESTLCFRRTFYILLIFFSLFLCLGKKYEVHVESGLAHEKGLEILSLFVNMKISELPEQANCLVRECKGILVTL